MKLIVALTATAPLGRRNMKYVFCLFFTMALSGCASTPKSSFLLDGTDPEGVYHKYECNEVDMPDDETHTGKREPREPRETRINR